MDLLVSTRSQHKMTEIRAILGGVAGLRVLSLVDVGLEPMPEEDGLEPYDTFEANARSKAAYFQRRSGLPTVADDSGIVVDLLDGEPGVRSKRFAPVTGLTGQALDDANNRHLLGLLGNAPLATRTAHYVCVAVLDTGDGDPIEFRGEAHGLILEAPRGAGGFGYDPLFYDEELGLTFAEISQGLKNGRSHRGRAFKALGGDLAGR